MNFNLPDYVRAVLNKLTDAGYSAYVVGGAVRDIILGKYPHDYDIATDAHPEEVVRLATESGWRVAENLGHNYGVVVLSVQGRGLEIATFRGERYGYDSHRPAEVWFGTELKEDLSRRDFTMNAMAIDKGGAIIDPYGGQADIAARVIRTVGDADKRFAEDGLRMFRACRFAGQLGYRAADGLTEAIQGNLERVRGLSLERVRSELEKLLVSQSPSVGLDMFLKSGLAGMSCMVRKDGAKRSVPIMPELLHLDGMPQNPLYHRYDCWEHILKAVEAVPASPVLRWAALLHDIAKGLPDVRGTSASGQPTDYGHEKRGADIAERILARFEVAADLRRRVVWLVSRHMRIKSAEISEGEILRWVRQEARSGNFRRQEQMAEAFEELIALTVADRIATGRPFDEASYNECAKRLRAAVRSMPVHTMDIAYDTQELMGILIEPALLGNFLRLALMRIQDGNLPNEREAVVAAARKRMNDK